MYHLRGKQITFDDKLLSFEVWLDRTYCFIGPDCEHLTIGRRSDKDCRVQAHLYIMLDVSLWTSLSTESHPDLCNKGATDESNGLLVTILAALFCNFCKVFSLVSPLHPQTEQQ